MEKSATIITLEGDLYKTTKEQVKYFLIYTTIGIIGLLMIAFADVLEIVVLGWYAEV